MSTMHIFKKTLPANKWLIIELLVLTTLYILLNYVQLIYPNDYIFYNSFNMRDNSIYWALINRGVWNGLIFFGVVYWLIPNFLSQRRWLLFTSTLILLFSLISLLQYSAEIALESIYDLPENLKQLFPNDEITGNSYSSARQINIRSIAIPLPVLNIFILFISFIYCFSRDWWRNVQIQSQLKEEKLKSELNFLRSQINPHFLFNTLNNIFSVARKNKDNETADLIAKLSDTMRYMLNEVDSQFIDLTDELDCIRNIIDIIKLRYSEDEVELKFKIDEETNQLKIAPLLLVPFVENAFKYGVCINKRSLIDISLFVENEHLVFTISNKIYSHLKSNEQQNGIGLINVKKRLELIYPNSYRLEINETDRYSVRLELKVDLC